MTSFIRDRYQLVWRPLIENSDAMLLLLLYEGINDYEDSEIRYNASEESEFEAPSCTNNGDKECSQEFDNASTSEVYDDVGSGAQKKRTKRLYYK